jgi:hypothetical protein
MGAALFLLHNVIMDSLLWLMCDTILQFAGDGYNCHRPWDSFGDTIPRCRT